jgi:hypothetical protein
MKNIRLTSASRSARMTWNHGRAERKGCHSPWRGTSTTRKAALNT